MEKIKLILGKFVTEIEEKENWDDTKLEVLGAVHRILLARDRNRPVEGVLYDKKL
jgi:hypothetical protein